MDMEKLVQAQRDFFRTGATLDLAFRHRMLDKLARAMREGEQLLLDALKQDLGKSAEEGYMCEVGLTLAELNHVSRHMDRWARDRRVPTPMTLFGSKSFTVEEPYGVTLIMSPWNYPLLLSLDPLIGAIAAGNCCVLKPSAYAPACSAAMAKLLGDIFPPEYVAVVQGGRQENQALLDQKFDYIFFTGGAEVGHLVMHKAAQHLTPVTLELGGKSPCIVAADADVDMAAKRIAFGKLLNSGQTCVAPDYVLIHRSVKQAFLQRVEYWMKTMYGTDALDNEGYVHIINQKHFGRLLGLIDPEKAVFGGRGDEATLRIQPTVLDNVTAEDPVMGEEIFGPILPLLTFDEVAEAEGFILDRPRPLALYLFTGDEALQRRILQRVPFGGGCINDTIMHLANSHLTFGGIGDSGMGSYHGEQSFRTFSHRKSIVKTPTWMDLPMRYAPYTALSKKLIRMFLK